MNSILQEMARRAPSLQVPLCADRMHLRFGDAITAAQCCDVHKEVNKHQASQSYRMRYAESDGPLHAVPREVDRAPDKSSMETDVIGLILPLCRLIEVKAEYIHIFGDSPIVDTAPCWVPAWSFYARRFCCSRFRYKSWRCRQGSVCGAFGDRTRRQSGDDSDGHHPRPSFGRGCRSF